MNVLCAWMAVINIIVGMLYSFQRENTEYLVEFVLGAMFTICIYGAVTL